MTASTTVILTIFAGVLTYIIGQMILKLVIEPILELRKTIGRISHSLIHYAGFIFNPGVRPKDEIQHASDYLRSLSSEIQSHLYLVPIYGLTAFFFRLPTKRKVLDASKALMGLSNSLFRESESVYKHNSKRVEKVCDSLDIYLPEEDRWPNNE
jgi:hypothetical protein